MRSWTAKPRRARGLTIWATLRAYGRSGYRATAERHLDLAQHLARAIDAAPDFERLAEVTLNIVAFRYRPVSVRAGDLDDLSARIGVELLADEHVYVGTSAVAG